MKAITRPTHHGRTGRGDCGIPENTRMSDTTHWIIPAASSRLPGCPQALERLSLPHLQRLLNRLSPTEAPLSVADDAPYLPHELAHARALGLPAQGDQRPWAAWHRLRRHQSPGTAAWAFVTPCHWQVGTDHITLQRPESLGLNEAGSRALLAIVAPWFAEDGITLHYESAGLWLAEGEPLRHYASPSLERVAGVDLRHWMQPAPAGAQATPAQQASRTLQRLHSEMQMLLYTHPFNDARAEQRQWPINAFWVHGAGALPAGWEPPATEPLVLTALQEALRAGDVAGWAQAWQALDAGPLAELAQRAEAGDTSRAIRLTLCGDETAQTWHAAPQGWMRKIQGVFSPLRATSVLEKL